MSPDFDTWTGTLSATLTNDELFTLSQKLSDWSHCFFLVGQALGRVALERRHTGRGDLGDEADNALWAERRPFCALQDELADLAAQARLARSLQKTG